MKKYHNFSESFKYECKVSIGKINHYGILSFDLDSGCRLSILGGIGMRTSNSIKSLEGYLSSGEKFVLYKCMRLNFDYFNSSNGFAVDQFHGSALIIGENISDDLKFSSVTFTTTNSKEFFHESNIDFDRSSNGFKVEISKLSSICISPNKNRKIEINRIPELNSNVENGIATNQICQIKVRAKSKVKFRTLLNDVQKIKNSIDLVSQCPSNIIYIKLDGASILYKPVRRIKLPISKVFPAIKYKEINDDYSDFMSLFFNSNKLMQRAMVEFFSVLHHHNRYGSDNYLSLCRSIEAFHRYNIKHNEYFRQRIVDVLNKYCKGALSNLKIGSIEKFAKNVKDCRNSLTHANLSPFGDAKKNFEIYKLQIQLEAVFSIVLLRHFGLNRELIHKKITQVFIP